MNHTDIEIVAEKIALSAREMSAEIDRERRLPDELVTRLNEAGLLRATMPREVAAPELSPGLTLRCAEALARGDASAGWCVSIAITSALLVAYLPASSREEMFGGGRGVAAGVWAPRGTAKSVDGGVVVSGRWPFCSGINHADMLFAGCFVDDRRVPSVVAIPKADLRILDTWHTLGLRGTGSHDSAADEVLVPADRVFSVFDGPILDRPLYRFPVFGFFALSIGAAALGNARAAIDDLVELAGGKKGLGSSRTLAERPATQASVAAAEASLSAARALYYESIEAAWQASQADDAVPVALRNRLRLAATHAVRTSADVVRDMYDLAGGSAIYDGAPLQRRFRDAFTATAHFQVNEASRELPGRVLLGQSADVSML
ncbi:hydroxylase [Mycobacterium sp. 852002-51163_SCH5372311]|uniref:acyl-CoA dehydrogenase family protein n=1 Tax=Mycobacterium sp. 852002-51163_SCH5372311 TaxID=1834097 RepID=UPI0007FCCB4A|nr:acyl-CoA dehydrogenase family protein [Mycobacterium sp. 852002-51163_SCH5372311]OBF81204.1 hydroxylase [Mycobacterium sp. 852002-51163_SCH5372311]